MDTKNDSDTTPCYIGRKACGCIVAACVDSPGFENDTALTIGGWVREQLAVERVTVAAVRGLALGCQHERVARQVDLFAGA